MVRANSNSGVSRRKYVAVTGSVFCGSTLISGNVLADDNSETDENQVERYEMDDGILISATGNNRLPLKQIQRVQENKIQNFAKPGDKGVIDINDGSIVVKNDLEENYDKNSNAETELIAYYFGWEDGAPNERKVRAPSNVSEEERKEIIENAIQDIEGQEVVALNDGEDVVGSDPDWGEPIGTLHDEQYVHIDGAGSATLGHFNLFARMWQAGDVDGNFQFGCTLGCLLFPGENLNSSTPGVTDPVGFNYHTEIEQDFFGNTDIVNYAPLNDSDGGLYGGVDLTDITFGADSSGPYGEVSLTPSSTEVDEIHDHTQPGSSVETHYEYGSLFNAGSHGGDSNQELGNSAVFLFEASPGNPNVNTCSIEAEFSGGVDDERHYESESLTETFSASNIDM
ncbi:hypothetical protein [Halostagnicola bangensis]